MGAAESSDEQSRLLSEYRNQLIQRASRRESLLDAISSLRRQAEETDQRARVAITQGQEDTARAFLARKLVAQNRITEFESELELMQRAALSAYRHGRRLVNHARFTLVRSPDSTGLADNSARCRLQAEVQQLDEQLARLRPERDQSRAELILTATKATKPDSDAIAVPGQVTPSSSLIAPLGQRNSRVIPQDVKIAVAARDGGTCRQCGSNEDLHFDHVIPWSKGGANTVKNIQLLCGPCNRRKGADDIPVVVSAPTLLPLPARTGRHARPGPLKDVPSIKRAEGSHELISLANFTAKDDHKGRVEVYGEVTNNDDSQHSTVIRLTLYDVNGQIISTGTKFISQLGPSVTKVFTVTTRDKVTGFDSMKVVVDSVFG